MDFIVSASTDVGPVKETNQDSLTVKVINTGRGRMVFAVLCDGMGGLEKGELASAEVVRAFEDWVYEKLPLLCRGPMEDYELRSQWEELVREQNRRIASYGETTGVRLGTTVVAMLLTQDRYYIMNIGDSRAYEILDGARQITEDHSLVAREVALGHLTEEEARLDKRRNVLLQCVGASPEIRPDMFFGPIQDGAVYMLCSDGFRHELSGEEMFEAFRPQVLLDENTMNAACEGLIGLNKQRGEKDNISVVLVRTF